jgi:hypothetical protein
MREGVIAGRYLVNGSIYTIDEEIEWHNLANGSRPSRFLCSPLPSLFSCPLYSLPALSFYNTMLLLPDPVRQVLLERLDL